MKLGEVNRRIGQTFFDETGFSGTESAEGPAGSPGILVADGSDQSEFAGIIALWKRSVGTGVGVSRSVVRREGSPADGRAEGISAGRNGSACHKAGTGQNQRADNILRK